MKNLCLKTPLNHSLLALLLGLSMFSHWHCKKDETPCPLYNRGYDIVTNPTAQADAVFGQWDNFNTPYNTDFLVAQGWAITDITSVNLWNLDIDLRTDSQGPSFSDFDSAEIIMDGLSIATMPAGTTGRHITFSADKDVKFAFANPNPNVVHSIVFQGVTNKAIPSMTVSIRYYVQTCGN